jgi:hypothetical protein
MKKSIKSFYETVFFNWLRPLEEFKDLEKRKLSDWQN